MSQAQLLLTPGPSMVPQRVLDAMALPMVHHRTKDFVKIAERVDENLKKAFCTSNPVVSFASSGTGAMEASIVNLFSAGDKVIAAYAGKFGERYRDIAKAYGLQVVEIVNPSGEVIRPEQVAEALKQHPDAKAVLMTHLETSTGVAHPIEGVSAVTRNSSAILMVDAISGLTCDPLKQDAWGVDVVVSGSQKGFMLPPGLAFLSVSPKAQALIPSSKIPKYYFHLGKAIKALDKHDSPYTPAVSLVRGLDVALELILTEGIENVWARHAKVASWVRAEVKKLGLSIFAQAPSSALTSVTMPASVNSGDLIKHMRDKFNIITANGQSELEGKILRFAHMGDAARPECAQRGLEAFKSALASVGYATNAVR